MTICERVEAFLDLRSQYNWERSAVPRVRSLRIAGLLQRETPSGEFDPLDPNSGNNADSSTILVGETRQRLQLDPTFEYELTERVQLGVGLDYETRQLRRRS